MSESSKTPLIIAFVVVIAFSVLRRRGNDRLNVGRWDDGPRGIGGYRMGHGWISGGFSWMWIPALVSLGFGVLLGWTIFAKK